MNSSEVLHRGLPVPYVGGGSLLLCNVVNWAKSDGRVLCVPICSFYAKTNIVTLTCPSYLIPSLPPHLSVLQWLNWWDWYASTGAARVGCQTCATGNKHFVPMVG